MKLTILIGILVIIASNGAGAATLRVERDGSGDFIEIQAAVDAAASGDTLLIGPGRWDATTSFTAPAGWTTDVNVVLRAGDLTLIGSGQGVTTIGPATPPHFSIPGPIAVLAMPGNDLRISNLTIENMRDGLYFPGENVDVENVQFLTCEVGSSTWGTGTHIYRDCQFDECLSKGIFGTSAASTVLVLNCRFDALHGKHLSFANVEDVLIDNCDFLRATISIQFEGPLCAGTIQNCRISPRLGGAYVTNGARMTLTNNEIEGGNWGQLYAVSYAHVSGTGNIFRDSNCTNEDIGAIHCYLGTLDLRGNHILRGQAPYAVRFRGFEITGLTEQHLENNYWGTSHPDSVAAWIWDENDDPALNIVTFTDPFHGQPVGNEDLSFGELKRLYR